MEQGFSLLVVGFTSVVAYILALTAFRLSARHFRAAVGKAFETIGMMLVFFAVNLALAVAVILVARNIRGFVSLYLADDIGLLVLSCLQGLAFQCWRETSGRLQGVGR